jgi:hypothetical protein
MLVKLWPNLRNILTKRETSKTIRAWSSTISSLQKRNIKQWDVKRWSWIIWNDWKLLKIKRTGRITLKGNTLWKTKEPNLHFSPSTLSQMNLLRNNCIMHREDWSFQEMVLPANPSQLQDIVTWVTKLDKLMLQLEAALLQILHKHLLFQPKIEGCLMIWKLINLLKERFATLVQPCLNMHRYRFQ